MKPYTLDWINKAEGGFYFVEFRYPGDFATKDDARDALRICKSLRNAIRHRFGMNN